MKNIFLILKINSKMQTKTLEITLDRARELYLTASPEFKVMLEDNFSKSALLPDIMDRIQDFNDVLRECGKNKEEFERLNRGLEPDEVAYRQKRLIVQAYNNGELANYSNPNQRKWRPLWDMSSGFALVVSVFTFTYSRIGARLSFLKEDHSNDAAKKFKFINEVLMTK